MSVSDLAGIPVVRYDGDNADEIIKALGLEIGDAIVCAGHPFIVTKKLLDELPRGDDPFTVTTNPMSVHEKEDTDDDNDDG